MKKRSRLDLSVGVADDKTQAAGFEQVAAASPQADDGRIREERPGHTKKTGRQSGIEHNTRSRAVIIKTLVVATAAALAFYLLKRRLF